MPQSLAQIHIHLVFSTKNRAPVLHSTAREQLHACVGGILRHHASALLVAGSVMDHIHLLVVQPRTSTPAKLVQDIKTGHRSG